jgi:hypothetical protein
MIQAPEASSQTRKNPRRQFTCALLLTGVSTTRRGIPKWGIRGCSNGQIQSHHVVVSRDRIERSRNGRAPRFPPNSKSHDVTPSPVNAGGVVLFRCRPAAQATKFHMVKPGRPGLRHGGIPQCRITLP